ncbi:MAG: hypothetical protein ACT4OX_10575 [Actinomycetota bacterium]
MPTDTSAIGKSAGPWRVVLDRAVLAPRGDSVVTERFNLIARLRK